MLDAATPTRAIVILMPSAHRLSVLEVMNGTLARNIVRSIVRSSAAYFKVSNIDLVFM